MNFSFALFEQLLFTICSLKIHSLQVCYFHSALNTASILTNEWVLCLFIFYIPHQKMDRVFFLKEWQVFFSHLNFWTSNMACYIADCGHAVDMGFISACECSRGLLRRLCLRSIKGVISYILLLLLLLFKKIPMRSTYNFFASTIVKI